MSMVRVLNWNGKDLPPELKELPAGEYVIERVDHALTPEEEQGLDEAYDQLDQGKVTAHEEVLREIREKLKR
jgi:hypothetical protein